MSLCSPFWQHVVGTAKSAPWEFTSTRVSHYSRKKWVSEKGSCCSIPSNISKCPQTTVCAWCSLTLEAPRQRLWVVHSGLCQPPWKISQFHDYIYLDHISGCGGIWHSFHISFSNWTSTVVRRPSSSSSTPSCRPRSSASASWHDQTQPEHPYQVFFQLSQSPEDSRKDSAQEKMPTNLFSRQRSSRFLKSSPCRNKHRWTFVDLVLVRWRQIS